MARKKHATIRCCAKLGRDRCNDCDETKHTVDDCDVLAQKKRRDEKLKEPPSDNSHDHDDGDDQDSG